jgi:hypothetical protein
MTHEINLVTTALVPVRIMTIRCQKVIIDADLANLYGVPTKALNQVVKRNQRRFVEAIRQLTAPADLPKHPIGFTTKI